MTLKEQLEQCDKLPKSKEPIDLDKLFSALYRLKLARLKDQKKNQPTAPATGGKT